MIILMSCITAEEVSDLCSGILSKEREDLVYNISCDCHVTLIIFMILIQGVSASEQKRLDKEVEEYKLKLEDDYTAYEARFKTECQRLEEEIRMAHTSRMRLRTVSVGSSVGLSLSNHESNNDSSIEGEGDDESPVNEEEEEMDRVEDGVSEDQNNVEVTSELDKEEEDR